MCIGVYESWEVGGGNERVVGAWQDTAGANTNVHRDRRTGILAIRLQSKCSLHIASRVTCLQGKQPTK